MPLKLNIAEAINKTIDAFEITAFAVDLDRNEIHVTYDKGEEINGVFTPILRDFLITIDGANYAPAIAKADTYANAMAAGSVSVYGALKLALYDEIQADTGLTGAVS